MDSKGNENFRIEINKLQQNVDVIKQKRYDINKKIEEYFSIYQNIENEMNKSYLKYKNIYDKRREYCNEKIKDLRNKKNEYQKVLNNLIDKNKSIQKPKIDNQAIKNINSLKNSILQLNHKIRNLEDKIKTTYLNIDEENEVVNEIQRLLEIKQEKSNLLAKKEQEQVIFQQNNEYNINQKNIQSIKSKLENIRAQMKNISTQKLNNRKLLIDLFQKVYDLRNNKKKMEKALMKDKGMSEQYYIKFSKLLHYEKESPKKTKTSQHKKKKNVKPIDKMRTKRKELLKKIKQKKIKIALEKQKAGKRLDINEYRLIMGKKKTH